MDNSTPELHAGLLDIVKQLAGYGEELWDTNDFRDGYKKVRSGLIIDARKLLKRHNIEFEEE